MTDGVRALFSQGLRPGLMYFAPDGAESPNREHRQFFNELMIRDTTC